MRPVTLRAAALFAAIAFLVPMQSSCSPTMTSPPVDFPVNPAPPKTAAPLSFATVSAGTHLTCGVTTKGAAYCWGTNVSGTLGNGSTVGHSTVPVLVSGALNFAMVSSGELHACGVTTAGTAYCWGGDFGGDLGNGMIATLDCLSCGESDTPGLVSGGLTFATVTAEGSHTCGLTTQGNAYCWGDNSYGEAGNNSADSSITTPMPVTGGLPFAQLSAGYRHTCGVTTSGLALCCGANFTGQLGNDNTSNSPIPVTVSGGLKFVSVSGGFDHTCGVTTSGEAYCWGLNIASELGDGTMTGPQQCETEACSTRPSAVASGLAFASVSAGAGGFHSCGLTTSGAAYCWGDNSSGELGNGTNTSSDTPVAVAGGLTFTQVSTGYLHTCGVTRDGVAYCWGDNYSGNLGIGTQNDASTPTPVLGPQIP